MRVWALGAAIALSAAIPCPAFLHAAWEQKKQFGISGVVVSARDGSPVPFCRLTASAVLANRAAEIDSAGGRRSDRPDFRAGMEASGPPGFPGEGGRQGAMSSRARQGAVAEGQESATADSQGHFTLTLPHAGAWRVSGEARGFRAQNYEAHESFYAQVVLSDAAPAYALSFRMVPDSLLSGIVFDEAGEPLQQARVTAERITAVAPGQVPGRARASGNAVTDDRGRYEISGLAPGVYRVRLQAQPWYTVGARGGLLQGRDAATQGDQGASLDPSLDLVYATTWFPGVDREESAETFSLLGGEAREADFHLNAIAAIHLQIPHIESPPTTQGSGRLGPQRFATITRVSGDGSVGSVSPVAMGRVDAWDFGGLTPGIYEIRVPGTEGQQNADVRQIEVLPGSRGVLTLDNARPLTRVSIRVEGADDGSFPRIEFLDLETGRRITASEGRGRGRGGQRGGDPAPDSIQSLTLDQGPPVLTAMLPPHRYAVSVLGNGPGYLTGMEATDAHVNGLTIEIASGTPTLTLRMASGRAELAGFVREDAKPVTGTMVLLVPAMLGQPGDVSVVLRAESNTDGSFTFRAVVPGRYIAVAIDHGWEAGWSTPEMLTKYLVHGVPIELKAGARLTQTLDAVLP